MNELSLEALQKLCDSRSIKWTKHVAKRLQERFIYREDVYNVIISRPNNRTIPRRISNTRLPCFRQSAERNTAARCDRRGRRCFNSNYRL